MTQTIEQIRSALHLELDDATDGAKCQTAGWIVELIEELIEAKVEERFRREASALRGRKKEGGECDTD